MQPDVDAFVDRGKLTAWLDAHAPAIGTGPLQVDFLHGGTSNIILALDRGGERAVLRRAPVIAPPNSEKAMAREARLLAALGSTDVPHPRLHGYCGEAEVIGSPFYVMARIDGWAPTLHEGGCSYLPRFDVPEHRRAMGLALVDALALLARVDHVAIGLGDFGRPGSFLGRQVDRWRGQLEGYAARYPAYRPRALPGIDAVAEWLRTMQPRTEMRGILHGDYGPPNLLFAPEPPVRVAAIVDWELATIGDPMLDLALFLINLRDEQRPDEIPAAAYFDPADFPTRQELVSRYGAATGWDMSAIRYYQVLVQFRMACILEYKVAVASGMEKAGAMSIFPDMVINLMAQAHRMIRQP